MKKAASLLVIVSIALFSMSCTKRAENTFPESNKLEITEEAEVNDYSINKDGSTIKNRYPAPKGYLRVDTPENSFAEFLRNQKLKPYGDKALFYNGKKKNDSGIYDSVFDVDIGNRDLHQCADAVMLLRAEYLYANELYDQISFNFVSGFKAEYIKWMEGYRINVDGNNVNYFKNAEPSTSYESFRKYMDMVMAYASTLSLEKELTSVGDIADIEIGDVFIVGGSPGHAVIVVDIAANKDSDKIFLLAQSYMPAQQTQILISPLDEDISPWYSLKNKDRLITPEWNFDLDTLKRF